VAYVARYTTDLKTCLEKYAHLKNKFEKKKDYILESPLLLGEPLKHKLNGLRSFPLGSNFLIIFIVCDDCRRLKQKNINGCPHCEQTPKNTVFFLLFGPHDLMYKTAASSRKNLKGNEFDVFT